MSAWEKFCDAMDRVRVEQEKIARKNAKLRAKADAEVALALAAQQMRRAA